MVGVRCIQTTIRINQPFRPIGISATNFQSKCDSLMVIDGLGKGEHKEVFFGNRSALNDVRLKHQGCMYDTR